MNKFTVISVNDDTGAIHCDHVVAVDGEQALAQISTMEGRALENLSLVVCIPGHLSEAYTVEGQAPDLGLVYPGEGVVDAHEYTREMGA